MTRPGPFGWGPRPLAFEGIDRIDTAKREKQPPSLF